MRGIIQFLGLAPKSRLANASPVDEIGLDDEDVAVEFGDVTTLEPIGGYSCILAYQSAKGAISQRQVSCTKIERAAGVDYLRAFCHVRQANRTFRISRVVQIIDLHTGEVIDDPAAFFDRFQIDVATPTSLNWGMPPVRRADMLAALNVLAFLARCDGRFHPAEREAIERFVCGLWMRGEYDGDPPINVILDHADRLKPDAEIFYISLERVQGNPLIKKIMPRAIVDLIEADGVISREEHHYAQRVVEYLNGDG